MAAAIIPLVVSAISAIGPHIPDVVQLVEGLFGHSAVTGSKDGAAKSATAVSLLTTALTALANAGKIPSTAVVDPSLPAGLAGAVQQVFGDLTAKGLLNGAAPAPNPSPMFNFPFLGKWEITAVKI